MQHIKYQKMVWLGILIVSVASFLPSHPTHAATRTISLTAMPAVIDTGGKAGEEVEFSFQLTNNAETIMPIHMSSRDSRTREGQAEDAMRSLSAKDWVTYAEPDFIIQSKETKEVNATLKIPPDAGPGGHYADLVVQSLKLEGDDSGITTQPEIAIQMLVGVVGDIKEDLSATLNGPSTVILNPSTSGLLTYTVKNNGNIHTMFLPQLRLKHKRQDALIISSQPEILLPGEKKQIRFDLPKDLRRGLHSTQMLLTYGTPSKEIASPEAHLLILPFNPKLLLGIPLVAAVTYIYKRRQRVVPAIKIITKGK